MVERLVVDASIAVKWVTDEEHSEAAAALFDRSLLAPDLLLVEVTSALWRRVIRGEMTAAAATRRINLLRDAPVDLVPSAVLMDGALELGVQLRHSVYDCLYLSLALGQNVRLVTQDRRLLQVCSRAPSLAEIVLPLNQL